MVFKKINEARQLIKKSDLKKSGHNDYSKYDYFTPEQVSKLVNDACQHVGLFNKFDLKRTELGLMAELRVIDISPSGISDNDAPFDETVFTIATEIPQITATNAAQQLGGAVTYSERYLLMIAYDIKDSNLDFDSQKPKEEKKKTEAPAAGKKEYPEDGREWLDEKTLKGVIKYMNDIKPVMVGSAQFNTNQEIYDYIDGKFKMKKEYRETLKSCVTNETKDLPF